MTPFSKVSLRGARYNSCISTTQFVLPIGTICHSRMTNCVVEMYATEACPLLSRNKQLLEFTITGIFMIILGLPMSLGLFAAYELHKSQHCTSVYQKTPFRLKRFWEEQRQPLPRTSPFGRSTPLPHPASLSAYIVYGVSIHCVSILFFATDDSWLLPLQNHH